MKEWTVKKAMMYIERREFLEQSKLKLNDVLRSNKTFVEVYAENSRGEKYSAVEFTDSGIICALVIAIEEEIKEISENLKNIGVEE